MNGTALEIAQAIRTLPREEAQELRDWLEDYLEDQLQVTAEFAASIERGKKDLAEGKIRVRESDQA